MKRTIVIVVLIGLMTLSQVIPVKALVKYEEGSLTINGILLLQDYTDEDKYYYVPPYPRLATKKDGALEFLCVKFVDPEGKTNGGLLHFLADFSLPEDELSALEDALKKKKPGAEIMGAVRLFEGDKEEEDETSFKVVSAVLSDSAKGQFTHTLITSGHAPLTPGSKSAVAAILDQKGATLLWETLEHPTSDISLSIHAYYEAVVRAYNAKIFAEIGTVYKHFSSVFNMQQGYKKRELRNIVDELVRSSVIKIDVLDRSTGLGVDAKAMDRVTNLITDKIVDLMFDHKTGLSKIPEKEQAVQKGQIRGRQKKSWFTRTFLGGSGNPKYVSDDQFVMKKREDIQQSTFSVNLSKNTTIRVPLNTSGNMGGIYQDYKDDRDRFRVVNLADPSFEKREVYFKVDGDYLRCFEDTVNFVTVSFRKIHENSPDTTGELIFTHKAVKDGDITKGIAYPRLGVQDSSWLGYEYRLGWSVYDRKTVYVPRSKDKWLESNAPVINLVPPFTKYTIELDVDSGAFEENKVYSGVVEFRYVLVGKAKQKRKAVLRANDPEQTKLISVYYDRNTVPEYRITWYEKSGSGKKTEGWKKLDTTYLYLTPPSFSEVE